MTANKINGLRVFGAKFWNNAKPGKTALFQPDFGHIQLWVINEE
jgi:hypothetical protein